MILRVPISFLFLVLSAWGQAPVISGFVTFAQLDNNFGPGTELVIFGTFTTPSAGRDYTITIGGQTTGINVANNGVFILATIPPNAPAGNQTLVITYLGASSNALPITIAALAPEIQNYAVSFNTQKGPPIFASYRAFQQVSGGSFINPTAPAKPGDSLRVQVSGIGQNTYPQVMPAVTVAGIAANIIGVNPNPGNEQIGFTVPANAPLGIDPVVVTVAGVASNAQPLPVGAAPAIGGILNGASFGSPGVVAPGSIVSVFGANFGATNNLASFASTNVNGTSVQFGGTAAPIFALAATSGQINALVPMNAPAGAMGVTVTAANGTSSTFNVTVVPAAPGMFYLTDPLMLSRRNVIAVMANTAWLAMPLTMAASLSIPTNCSALGAGAICARPATAGDILQLYVTGLGLATPGGDPTQLPLATGSVAPASGNPLYQTLLTPTVTIGGQAATVLFSGLAPGYSGLYQVDVQVPPGLPVNDDTPIQITCGGLTDSATISVM
jgi:uncharacterized protein (TIGR03437 family)